MEFEALGRTQEILGRWVAEALSSEQPDLLQPRQVAKLGRLASGFCRQLSARALPDQEITGETLIRERDASGEMPEESEDRYLPSLIADPLAFTA